jgi:hypothetical protein
VRQVTRRVAVALGLVVVALLALGAVPSALGSGPTYHLVVTETDDPGPAVNATALSERRYPYLTAALDASDGRSPGYRRGRFGLKEAFAHSPFDERDALVARNRAAATDDGAVRVVVDGRRYRAEVRR